VNRALRNTLVVGLAAALVMGAAALSVERRLEPFAERASSHRSAVHTIGWLEDGTLLSASVEGFRLWDLSNPFDRRWGSRVARGWESRAGDVIADHAAIAGITGQVVVADRSGSAWIWSARERSFANLAVDLGDIRSVAVTGDGRIAAFGLENERTLEVWDIPRRARLWRSVLDDYVTGVTVSAQGSLVVVGARDRAIVYDASGRTVRELAYRREAAGTGITALAISPDGSRLALALRGIVVQALGGDESEWNLIGSTTSISFSSNGRVIAAANASEDSVEAFDADTLALIAKYPLHQVCSLAFRPDGDLLAAGTQDGHVVFLDLTPTGFVAR
jgi:WD40 repeat protein